MRYDKKQLNVYRGVLKNKNLSSILADGLNAPVGSTKRKKAQKVLSVIRKTTMDGKGGPGPRVPQVNVQLRPNTVDYSNFIIFPPTPPIRVPIGEKAPTPKPEYDGQGYTPMPGMDTQPTTYAAPPTNIVGGLGALGSGVLGAAAVPFKLGDKYVGQPSRDLLWGIASAPFNKVNTVTNQAPAYQVKTSSPMAVNLPLGAKPPQSPSPIRWGVGADAPPITRSISGLPQYGSPVLNALTGKTGPMSNEQFLANLKNGTAQQNSENVNPVAGMSLKDLSISLAGGTPGGGMNESTSIFQTPKFANVQNAVDAGTGPSLFAYNTLNAGGDALKALAPNASSLMLDGGGLYDRLMKIEENTRKSYGLDQMRDQLNSMVMSGQTLEGRLTDYIRGRDEFLNETESTLSDLKAKSMKMDMSDPRTQANMQQHFNYLYELRGRQNKRYVEFLDMSVQAYQGKIDRVKNMYDTSFAQYEQQVLNNQNIAKEEYQMIFNGLQEMYNETANAEAKMYELETMKYEAIGARMATIKDGVASEGMYSGDYEALYKTLSTVGVLGSNGEWKPNNNALTISGENVWRLPEAIDEGVARAMYTYDKDGVQTPQSLSNALYITQNALGHLEQLKNAQVITEEEFNNRSFNVRNHLERHIKQNTNIFTNDNLPSYKEAIESLAGDGWIFNRSTPSRDKFVQKWGAQSGAGLDDSILNSIYTYMEQFGNPREYVDTFLQRRGDLGQNGDALSLDALGSKLLQMYMGGLKPQQITGQPNFSKVGGGTNSASIAQAAQAIKNIESGGGNYRALGPVLPSGQYAGDRAYGAYQVMGKNIPSWTQEALGYSMTPEQFLNNPQAQDAVFAHFFGKSVQQHGTVEDAASIWFSGQPLARAGNARDVLGTTVPKYVRDFQASYYG